jgi:5'(3')-deoxyribonucleotidase
MSKQTIAVDVDDVLSASAPGFVDFSNKMWGTRLHVDDYTEDWAMMWGMNQQGAIKRSEVMRDSNLVNTFRKLDEAEAVLRKLSKRFKLVITTSRGAPLKEGTWAWLQEHFGGIFEEVHHTGFFDGQHENPTSLTKGELCRSIGADYLIDDQPKHCFAAAEVGIPALLFGDYKWNRDLQELPPGVTRVMTWQDIEDYFDGR